MLFWKKYSKTKLVIGSISLAGAGLIILNDKLWGLWLSSATTQSLILWFTAIAIILYTKETYDLKQLASEDLEIARETQRIDFLPIISPIEKDSILQGSLFRVNVKNVGKGIARDVELQVGGLVVAKGYTIEAGEDYQIKGEDPRVASIMADSSPPKTLNTKVLYKDIFGRHFRTVGAVFNLDMNDSNTRYTLSTTQWEYKLRYRKAEINPR